MNWQDVLDTIDGWKTNPEQCDEPGFKPPSDESLRRAKLLAENFRDRGEPCPLRVVPNGGSGISFERDIGKHFENYQVCSEGLILRTLSDRAEVVDVGGGRGGFWKEPDLPTGWSLSSCLTDGLDAIHETCSG